MTRCNMFVLTLVGTLLSSRAMAQEGLEFTLDDVDAADKQEPPAEVKPSADPKQAIADALGALRWGMSKAELIKLLTLQIRAEFEQRIKVERDIMRQDAIYQESRERARRLSENFVSFDEAKNGWDVSPIAREFTRGNKEAMLVVAGKGTRDMYFFIQGKLWKWYREISPEAGSAVEALQSLRSQLGKGKRQQDRRDESNNSYDGTSWSDGATRVTVLQRGSDSSLIFEDLRTVENLDKLRFNAQAKKASSSTVVDLILLTDAERKDRGL